MTGPDIFLCGAIAGFIVGAGLGWFLAPGQFEE